ncbi:MAG: phosphatidate cytidylyltransferase [Sandarakinorhabdus sp.]|nr:phosphatidate cytidylyltransferase [Sandarakinorhabdus sp.]
MPNSSPSTRCGPISTPRRWPGRSPNFRPGSGALADAEVTAQRNPLGQRIVTGVVLIIVALVAVWLGGPAFSALIAAATLIMFTEWAVMHRLGRGTRLAGLVLLAGVLVVIQLATPGEAVVALSGGAGLIWLFAARMQKGAGSWAAAGLLYAGLPALALIWVRGLPLGLPATVFLLVCVWSADIVAFFTGRAIGGPKLAPAISPNKTWSGAIGGIVGAMVIGGGLAAVYLASLGGIKAGYFFGLAGGLAALSVLGDLLESGLKRRAGVKDSGNILPGHGGVMDRLDGLVPVAVAGAAVFAATGWAG